MTSWKKDCDPKGFGKAMRRAIRPASAWVVIVALAGNALHLVVAFGTKVRRNYREIEKCEAQRRCRRAHGHERTEIFLLVAKLMW
jgi:hypothetical protein